MTLQYPGERALKALVRHHDQKARLRAVLQLGPRAVYCGLLWIQRRDNLHPKLPLAVFRGLYGTWPRSQDKGEPAPPEPELEEWFVNRPKKSRRRS